mmetsp:Transcript_13565/g.49336  ORF Transcript_13565/g.49336 Transcript_13565/m.49336 type:complete len:414 (+) Transcript_13565:20-1261(+)
MQKRDGPNAKASLGKQPDISSFSVFKRGVKHDAQVGEAEYEEELNAKLDKVMEVVAAERKTYRNKAAILQWNAYEGLAEVPVLRGNFWPTMGFNRGPRQFLHVEEAVYLVEYGQAVMFLGRRMLSVQEMYSLMANEGFPLHWYCAYANLLRLGYIVRRFHSISHYHPPPVRDETASTDPPAPNLEGHAATNGLTPSLQEAGRASLLCDGPRGGPLSDCDASDLRALESTFCEAFLNTDLDQTLRGALRDWTVGADDDSALIDRPSTAGADTRCGWWPDAGNGTHPWLRLRPGSQPASISSRRHLASHFARPTHRCETRDRPGSNRTHLEAAEETAQIVFDVFSPNFKFSKKQAQKPDFRVAIGKNCIPAWDQLRELRNESEDVPLQVMYVDGDANLMFNMALPGEDLPLLRQE